MPVFTRSISDLHDRKLEYEFVRVLRTWKGLFPEPIVRELERRHGMLAGPNYSQNSGTAAAPQASTKRPRNSSVSSAVRAVLIDLRDAVSQPPHLYQAPLVASIFAHVQINRVGIWNCHFDYNPILTRLPNIFHIDTNLVSFCLTLIVREWYGHRRWNFEGFGLEGQKPREKTVD